MTTLLAIAFAMRAVGVAGLVNADEYDEGVYWQSLRAMSHGYHLYEQIFCSQPPLFLVSVYPFFALLGATLDSARVGVAVVSMLGLAGAYLVGEALGGRVGGVTALVLAMVAPNFLAQSQFLQAEAPSVALLFLTVGCALQWNAHPTGRQGVTFAVLCGLTLPLGILIKLSDITAVVPIALLILGRLAQLKHEPCAGRRPTIIPVAAGLVASVIAMLLVLTPFWSSLSAVLHQSVMFHLAAEDVTNVPQNMATLRSFLAANAALCAAAAAGILVASLRHDPRLAPMTAWLLVSILLLAAHVPLFPRHLTILIPPLISCIVLGMSDLPDLAVQGLSAWRRHAALAIGCLVVAAVLFGIRDDYHSYRRLHANSAAPDSGSLSAQMTVDLQNETIRDQWVITDAQLMAAQADRDTPPWLVDTSFLRIRSGHLSRDELVAAADDQRVHAVLFATGRLTTPPVAGFRDWVADHFRLRRTYGDGSELWTR